MEDREKDSSLQITDYYYILLKRKWIILGCAVAFLLAAVLISMRMKPVYRATSTITIEKEQSVSPLTGERIRYESYLTQSLTFNTHFKLILARPVLERVVTKLNLDRLPKKADMEVSLFREVLGQAQKNLRTLMGRTREAAPPADKMSSLIGMLKSKIETEQVRDTRLLRINVEDRDPERAMEIANALAGSYIEFDMENTLANSRNTMEWMERQSEEMRQKLEDAEAQFQAYRQQEKLFSIEGRQSVISQKIAEFNDAYIKARNRRLELDARLAELRRKPRDAGDIDRVATMIENDFIRKLYEDLLAFQVEETRLSKVYKQKHPRMLEIRGKVADLEKKIQEEIQKEIQKLQSERTVLLSREDVLQKTIADFENEALQLNEKALQYKILQRNVDTYQKLYDVLMSKTKESTIVDTVVGSNIRIVEKAEMPRAPVRPNKKRIVMLSLLLGLAVGVGLSFLAEYTDRTLHDEDDVHRYLDLPVLSVIPLAARDRVEKKGSVKKQKVQDPEEQS